VIIIQVSIDGPAGAGKSSVARALAEALGFIHIDTGAMYRAVTWLSLQQGVGTEDGEALSRLAETADIAFIQGGPGEAGQQVMCQGRNITEDIRSAEVGRLVSRVSAVAGVRAALVEAQRRLAAGFDVVMDGRDIGTVVLPGAECKIFLTASVEERAKRRMKQREGKDSALTLDEIAADIEKRDRDDENREISPLVMAKDSILLDTTSLRFREAVDAAYGFVLAAQKN